MTSHYCMAEKVICSFDSPKIQVKLVKAEDEDGEEIKDLYHVRWKSNQGKAFVNVLKKPTNYRDASELYFEMTNTCLKSNNNNSDVQDL